QRGDEEDTAMSLTATTMNRLARAHYREAGAGNAVASLPPSARSSAQWRPLMDPLAGRFHTLAADLYGSGQSPAWSGERPLWLPDGGGLVVAGVGARGPELPPLRPPARA